MLTKKITTKKAKVLDTEEQKTAEVPNEVIPTVETKKIVAAKYDFPVNTSFFLSGKTYLVRKAFHQDATDFRLVYSEGNEEIYMLSTLQKDAAEDLEFKVL